MDMPELGAAQGSGRVFLIRDEEGQQDDRWLLWPIRMEPDSSAQRLRDLDDGGPRLCDQDPVSYTHLDVYKRQIPERTLWMRSETAPSL